MMRLFSPRGGRAQRVLIIVENEPVPHDRRPWAQAQALQEAGYLVSVVCPKDTGDPWYARQRGIHLYKFPPPPVARGTFGFCLEFAYSWLMILALTTWVFVRRGFDVIQACNPPDILFTIALPFKVFGTRFVFDHHDLAPEMYEARFGRGGPVIRLLKLLERWSIRTADHVIATNDSHRLVALGRGMKDPASVTVVRNGPDLCRMRPREPRPELKEGRAYLCCWLGVMVPAAGIDLALRSVQHLVHVLGRRDCLFVFVGDGEMLADMEALAFTLGVADHVRFPGWAKDEVWFDYLSTADVGLLPWPRNGKNERSTAIKAMEYMAFELPVVAFDLHETRISTGGAALYAEPNDPVDLARCIERVLDAPEVRTRMGRLGRTRLEEEGLSWEQQKQTYVALFDDLLALEVSLPKAEGNSTRLRP